MGTAFAWGLVAASSLLLGGLLAARFQIGRQPLGLVMAFGSGVLISAVAYELVQEAFETTAGSGGVALGPVRRMRRLLRRRRAHRPARRSGSCSASSSTASPSRWCWGSPSSRGEP